MLIIAKASQLRVSPRKMALVVNLVRNVGVKEARLRLKFSEKKAGAMLLKVLDSAVANAEHNFKANVENLYVAEIFVSGGPRLKRRRYVSRAGVTQYHKPTSHLTLKLGEKEAKKPIILTKETKTVTKKPRVKGNK